LICFASATNTASTLKLSCHKGKQHRISKSK
jgi:hypothetical protein